MNAYEEYLPEEFKSGNNVPIERATITRKRMLEIIGTVVDQIYEDAFSAGRYHVHGIYS